MTAFPIITQPLASICFYLDFFPSSPINVKLVDRKLPRLVRSRCVVVLAELSFRTVVTPILSADWHFLYYPRLVRLNYWARISGELGSPDPFQ
ncbi:hypothetical protein O181_051738 [Austropuccinia psidii MF-1]|uniref:Uncharacterized protein n=1 Tax=Austropuccinia psidii MF-1 TaxID=1389203 RepID=A0A9Q3E477_9BASI|nr:hypothetical protein [Austropuccinia psidii MF-1]